MTTEVGQVELAVPRDRTGSFEPVIVPKFSHHLDGLADNVISLCAKGMTTGDIQNHLAEIYDRSISRETISKVTDRILNNRLYPVLLIDAIVVKVRSRLPSRQQAPLRHNRRESRR